MKKIIFGLVSMCTVSAFADTCASWDKNEDSYALSICSQHITEREGNVVELNGIYIKSAFDKHPVQLSKKNKVCQNLGYRSYIKNSAKTRALTEWVVRGQEAVEQSVNAIVSLSCSKS